MESLENKLFEAAASGSVASLQKLLKEDPLILDRVTVNCFSETPLHVAALLGHLDLVKEIISLMPQLAGELNSSQSSPLHLASAKGHVEVVKALLSACPEACLTCDKNGLTPLHLAALKGRSGVMKALLRAGPDAAPVTGYQGENILHLCVKHYQLEALKLLLDTLPVESGFLNAKDVDGNTILHLAVADKQVETINFLVTVDAIEVNALNLKWMTPMYVLNKSRRDVRDSEIEESLKRAGGSGITLGDMPPQNITENNDRQMLLHKQQENDWLKEGKNTLMVVCSLVATMAFQVGVNPPGGVWQERGMVDSHGRNLTAGSSIFAYNHRSLYTYMYAYNTYGSFLIPLGIIVFLMTDEDSLSRGLLRSMLSVMLCLSFTSIVLTYTFSVYAITPPNLISTRVGMLLMLSLWCAWILRFLRILYISWKLQTSNAGSEEAVIVARV